MIPRWSILIVSVEQRAAELARMLTCLAAQIAPHDGAVIVECYVDNFDRPRHEARNLLMARAAADYVSFVDDDDRLPDYFVDRVAAALATQPDYVGWRMQCIWAGETLKPTFHSIRYPAWSDDAAGFYRHISHLNPIRRDLAAQVPFPAAEFEDYEWAQSMHATGLVRTEAFIDDVMYVYDYDPAKSLVHGVNRTPRRPAVELPAHPLIRVLRPADLIEEVPV